MPTEFTVLGLTFHLYGLILGIAVFISLKIAEEIFATTAEKKKHFWDAVVWIIVCVLIGARLWHVMTDWHLYTKNPLESLYVWNGGLSIIGAIVGAGVGSLIAVYQSKFKIKVLELTDSLAVGIPFGQAIGRLGNWINQELYGSPTNLPWKLFIDPAHRLKGYEKVEYYHPLFAYELALTSILGLILWYSVKKYRFLSVGSGTLSLLYLAVYGWIRFFLEFLRLDKTVVADTPLGINQVVMLLVAIVCTVYILKKSIVKKLK